MKKLFLAVPFSGVDQFVSALAEETICRHDSDPNATIWEDGKNSRLG